MLERPFGRRADKKALPAVARDGAHDNHVGVQLRGEVGQFFVSQAGDQGLAVSKEIKLPPNWLDA